MKVAKILLSFLSLGGLLGAEAQAYPMVTNQTIKVDQDTRILNFEWDKFRIGFAEYPDGPTGCTVIAFPDRNVKAVVDLRGGATGSIFTNGLTGGMSQLDAIVLTGGSLVGLAAATGITAEIFKNNHYAQGWGQMPYVAGSVIFDWVHRKLPLYPTAELGVAAYKAAEPGKFFLGRHGVGISATLAKAFGLDYCQYSGQGGAVETFGEVKIAVFLVVNALGAIYNEQGKMVHGYVDPKTGKPLSPNELFHQFYPFSAPKASGQKGDTTLTVVIINMDLEMDEMGQIARQVHNSIAQVIRPFGTSEDGDTLYFVSTKERQLPTEDRENTIPRLGMLATRVAKKAIYSIFKPGA